MTQLASLMSAKVATVLQNGQARYDGLVGILSKLFEVELIVKFLSLGYCLEIRVLQLKSSTC